MDYSQFYKDINGLDIAGMQNYLKANHNVTDYTGMNSLNDYIGYAKGLYNTNNQNMQPVTSTVKPAANATPEDLTQYGDNYLAEINKRKSVNPNDPTISQLQTLRDQKLTNLYGGNFQGEIDRRLAIDPNDNVVPDLKRLMRAANNPSFTPPPVPTYQSPYTEQQQQALDDYNKWASQPYVSQYASSIEALVKNILARQFTYDPANDAQFQLASKELTRNVMESMNARGILNSSITEGNVQQGIADMMPQYKQMAYNQFINEGNMLMSQVDMLMGLDNTSYSRYQDQGAKFAKSLELITNLDQNQYQQWHDAYIDKYNQAKDSYNAAVDKITIQQNKVTAAWKNTDERGYVNNADAIILGVAPGTLSKDAREAKEKRAKDLADQKAQWDHDIEMEQKRFDNNEKLDKASAKLNLENQKAMEEIRNKNDMANYKEKAKIDMENTKTLDASRNKTDLETYKQKAGIDLTNSKALDDYRAKNDINVNAAKASSDKETQKLITFNDLQKQFVDFKKQITADQYTTDEFGNKVLVSKGLKPGSPEYIKAIADNLIPLVDNKIISIKQANQLAVANTNKSYTEVVKIANQDTNFKDTLSGYEEMLNSQKGLTSMSKMRAQIEKELRSFTKSDIEAVGQNNYKKLLARFTIKK